MFAYTVRNRTKATHGHTRARYLRESRVSMLGKLQCWPQACQGSVDMGRGQAGLSLRKRLQQQTHWGQRLIPSGRARCAQGYCMPLGPSELGHKLPHAMLSSTTSPWPADKGGNLAGHRHSSCSENNKYWQRESRPKTAAMCVPSRCTFNGLSICACTHLCPRQLLACWQWTFVHADLRKTCKTAQHFQALCTC